MKVAVAGANGTVGRWIARALRAAGHELHPLSRPGWRLGQVPDLRGCDALVHAALHHLPGLYRGGEGDDPDAFVAANLEGSIRLFEGAKTQGVGRVLFLSTRAVHDGHAPGLLADDLPSAPTTLYGEVKARAEQALLHMASDSFRAGSIRATGVYGPGKPQKWAELIGSFLNGTTPAPRIATEVHGDDLGRAALMMLGDPELHGSYNVSDLVLDRHDLLAEVATLTGCATPLPERADPGRMRILDCARLAALGWRPGGMDLLRRDLPAILGDIPTL